MKLEASKVENWYIKAIYSSNQFAYFNFVMLLDLSLQSLFWFLVTLKNALKFFIVNKNTQIRRCLYLAVGIFCCSERPLKADDGWTLLSEVFEAKKGIIATAVGTWHVIYRGKKWYYYSPCFSSSVRKRLLLRLLVCTSSSRLLERLFLLGKVTSYLDTLFYTCHS